MTLIIANGAVAAPGGGGVISSDQLAVTRDLLIISLADTANAILQPSATLGPDFGEVDYHQNFSGFGPDLLTFLVNATEEVIINGVDKASVGSLGGPTGLGGAEFNPVTRRVSIFYDTTQCGGRGSHVLDKGRNKIPDPSFIILAHELCHARDFLTGAINNSTPESIAERLAIIGENQSRAELSPFLSARQNVSVNLGQRDPDNHEGGCDTIGSTNGTFWSNLCFIATAAYGTVSDPHVGHLRTFRDNNLRRTHWGRAFFESFYAEYYSYSPRIAADMQVAPVFRQAISSLLVDPFLDFLLAAEMALSTPQEGTAFVERLGAILAHEPEVDVIAVAYALADARATLLHFDMEERPQPPVFSPSSEPFDQLKYVVQLVLSLAPAIEFSRWALIDPLCLHWTAIERIYVRHDPIDKVASAYRSDLAEWIANMPIPTILARLPAPTLAKDLAVLGEHTFRTPAVRRQVANRLLAVADAFPYEIAPILAQSGWVGHD